MNRRNLTIIQARGIKFTFITNGGTERKEVEGSDGENILDLSKKFDIKIDGPCRGKLACGSCKVDISEKHSKLIPPPSDEERDLLAFIHPGSKQSERLACQLLLKPELEGMIVTVPKKVI